jgi:glycosyltransferase involved in cell wall biosynthesis
MPLPFVSVVVPNYNHANHLGQRLDTVFNQTFTDFEVIILDDHSTDGSQAIFYRYNDPRIVHRIFSTRNSGNPFLQWKQGLKKARGSWVWFAESDDYADLSFLDKLTAAATMSPNIGLAYADSVAVDEAGNVQGTFAALKNKRFHTQRWHHNYTNNGADEIERYLLPGGTINNSSAVLFNREVLMKANPFDLGLRYIGDKYAFIKVLSNTDVAYVAEGLNFYRSPFNAKHADRYDKYFYEQFLVFDWVYRNMKIKDEKKFLAGFYTNTSASLLRGWGKEKVALFGKLHAINPYLFRKCVWHNLSRPLKTRMAALLFG